MLLSRKGDWLSLCLFLVWMPCTAAGLLPHGDDVVWSVDERGDDYRLAIDILVLDGMKTFWESRFNTGITLNKPLTFRLVSGNGVMVCTVKLETQGKRNFRLNYEIEAVVRNKSMPGYLKGSGDTPVMLGREVHVSPLGEVRVRKRLPGMAHSEQNHHQGGTVMIGFRVDPLTP